MRVLITGGRGQLGRSLGGSLAGEEVFALSHAEMDVTDAECVKAAVDRLRPELIVHAAAWTDTAGCEADPERALLVNGEGTRIVAEAADRIGATLVYVSSNEVFDGETQAPYTEEDEPGPINAYGRSKLSGEQHVQSIHGRHYIVRTAWLYGAGRVSFPEKILQAASKGGPLKGVVDEVATPTWTDDLAKGIVALFQRAPFGTYHLTNSGHCSRLEWVEEILRARQMNVSVEPSTQAEFGAPYRKPAFSALSLDKAERHGVSMLPWQRALAGYLGMSD